MRQDLYATMAGAEEQHWWFRARRHIVSEVLAGLAIPRQARVLDLGCGTGGNLAMLSVFGTVFGCEPDASAIAHAARRGQYRLVRARLPAQLPYHSVSFDLVAMTDVLEHVRDDLTALLEVRRLLKPGGRVILTVPAVPWLWSTRDVAHGHFRRYTKRQLTALLVSGGYKPEIAAYFNSWLFPPIAALRLVQRIAQQPHEDDLAIPPPWLNRFLESVMTSESRLVRRGIFPAGLSLIAVAHVPS